MENGKAQIIVGQGGLVCGDIDAIYRLSNFIASSIFCPKSLNGGSRENTAINCVVAISYGYEVGLKPLQAIQNIAVINGRPGLYGDALLALIRNNPAFEDIKETPTIENGETVGYTCTIKRKKQSLTTRTFTVKDAKAAGLWGKGGPWKNYPQRMLQMRARSWAIRDSFADALFGMGCVEELQDIPTKTIKSTKTFTQTKQPRTPETKQEQWAAHDTSAVDVVAEAGKKTPAPKPIKKPRLSPIPMAHTFKLDAMVGSDDIV